MSRLLAWLAISAVAAVMLGGSAWAWAQIPADAVLSVSSESTGGQSLVNLLTQSGLPFFCH
jgi:hypothetical protein